MLPVIGAIDVALWDLSLRVEGCNLLEFLGVEDRPGSTYASSINRSDFDRLMPAHSAMGQTAFKLKVGFDVETDLDFIEHAASALPAGSPRSSP